MRQKHKDWFLHLRNPNGNSQDGKGEANRDGALAVKNEEKKTSTFTLRKVPEAGTKVTKRIYVD